MTAVPGEAVLALDLRQGPGLGPGLGPGTRPSGLIAALADAAAAQAARSRMEPAREVVTVDLHLSQLCAPAGGRVVATARSTGGGRSLCFCEVQVEDDQGQLCAQAMVTLRYRDPG